jgi:hypothetical protein
MERRDGVRRNGETKLKKGELFKGRAYDEKKERRERGKDENEGEGEEEVVG